MDGDFGGDGQGIASAAWMELLPRNSKMTRSPLSLKTEADSCEADDFSDFARNPEVNSREPDISPDSPGPSMENVTCYSWTQGLAKCHPSARHADVVVMSSAAVLWGPDFYFP